MEIEALKNRFKVFALAIVQFAEGLPDTPGLQNHKRLNHSQWDVRCCELPGGLPAKINQGFYSKNGHRRGGIRRNDVWLEFNVAVSEEWRPAVAPLWKGADELLAITVSSIKTARSNKTSIKNRP